MPVGTMLLLAPCKRRESNELTNSISRNGRVWCSALARWPVHCVPLLCCMVARFGLHIVLSPALRVVCSPALATLMHKGEPVNIDEMLTMTVERKASDLHISAGLPPMIRVDGDLQRVD